MSDVAGKKNARLIMRNIDKSFGATHALRGVNLTVQPGEVMALLGENGAGKSTLMKVLSCAIKPDHGEMLLDGRPYRPDNPAEARRLGVGMIYQELSLTPHLSVQENIMLGMEPTRHGFLRQSIMRQTARDALLQLGHPEISPTMRAGALSVGLQQVVEIARALAAGCRVLVFDEPTSSLTQQDTEKLFELIARLREQDYSIIYISHFLEEVKRVADRFTVLRDGAWIAEGDVAHTDTSKMARLMVGREIADLYPRSPRQAGEVVIKIDELAGVSKPSTATLELRRGEILGIAGLVGSGRTELLRLLFGLDAVRRGQIRVGAHAGPASPLQRWRQGMGYLSENRKEEGLALSMTIADNITLTKLQNLGRWGWISPGKQMAAAKAWVQHLAIKCQTPAQRVGALSGGNQQKVALARLLYHDVDVLLLDEPTRGIDIGSKSRIYEMINELAVGDPAQGRPGRAILMVSSYLPELLGMCDRIAVMARGVLAPARPVAELDEHRIMLQATDVATENES